MKKFILIIHILFLIPRIIFAQEELFENFKQLLLRGQIPAIFEPEYVSAEEAEIDDDSWVFGIVIDNQARA